MRARTTCLLCGARTSWIMHALCASTANRVMTPDSAGERVLSSTSRGSVALGSGACGSTTREGEAPSVVPTATHPPQRGGSVPNSGLARTTGWSSGSSWWRSVRSTCSAQQCTSEGRPFFRSNPRAARIRVGISIVRRGTPWGRDLRYRNFGKGDLGQNEEWPSNQSQW